MNVTRQKQNSFVNKLMDGLSKIDQIALLGKFQVLCYQLSYQYFLAPEVIGHYLNSSPEDGFKSQ